MNSPKVTTVVSQYNTLCEQICQKLGWKFKEVKDAVIILEGDSYITLSDASISLLYKIKELEEIVGELKVDKDYLIKKVDNLKNTIKEFRISEARNNAVQRPMGAFEAASESSNTSTPTSSTEWDCA